MWKCYRCIQKASGTVSTFGVETTGQWQCPRDESRSVISFSGPTDAETDTSCCSIVSWWTVKDGTAVSTLWTWKYFASPSPHNSNKQYKSTLLWNWQWFGQMNFRETYWVRLTIQSNLFGDYLPSSHIYESSLSLFKNLPNHSNSLHNIRESIRI